MVNTLNKIFLRFPWELSVFFIEKTGKLQLTPLVHGLTSGLKTSFFVWLCYQSRLDTGWTLHIYCRKITFSTLGKRLGLLFALRCKNAGILQSTLPRLNRHWIDLVHPLSDNYFFYSRNTNVGYQQSISYVRPTFYRSL